jgi:hypothetical protein
MTQRDSRSGQHGQHGQQPSAGTTDSYETLASAPEITLATLSSTERQWRGIWFGCGLVGIPETCECLGFRVMVTEMPV